MSVSFWGGLIVGLLLLVLYQLVQIRRDVRWLAHRMGTWYGKGMARTPVPFYYAIDPAATPKPADQPGPEILWSGR